MFLSLGLRVFQFAILFLVVRSSRLSFISSLYFYVWVCVCDFVSGVLFSDRVSKESPRSCVWSLFCKVSKAVGC